MKPMPAVGDRENKEQLTCWDFALPQSGHNSEHHQLKIHKIIEIGAYLLTQGICIFILR